MHGSSNAIVKDFKDQFSARSDLYAKYRPRYPDTLFNYLLDLVPGFGCAWDCGTGNGQVAGKLAEKFARVHATDVSEQQLRNAIRKPNITYELTRAEHTRLPGNTVDLITAAQAIHWFDFDAYYEEVRRVARSKAIIAAWAYNRLTVSPAIDAILHDLYCNILGSYWDAERRFVDESYATIPFPFKEIEAPILQMIAPWTFTQLIGYLTSWSSVQNFMERHHRNPLDAVEPKIKSLWQDDETKEVRFPLFTRIGRIEK